MKTIEILNSIEIENISGEFPNEITGLTPDSRQVKPGNLFVAVPGTKIDGRNFISQALENGAAGVVVKTGVETQAPFIVQVEDPRASLADLAAAFYQYASRLLTMVGVTGSDGKTTTSHLISRLLQASNYGVGILNTVYMGINGDQQKNPFSLTTPGAVEIQAFLAEVLNQTSNFPKQAAVVEASSHAIALDRVRGIEFDAAVFTNIIPTHLEFHPTFEDYRATKARLFQSLGPGVKTGPKFGVINADDANADYFRAACSVPVVDYGVNTPSLVFGEVVNTSSQGSEVNITIDGKHYSTFTQLQGRYNVSNLLASVGVAYGLGLDLSYLMTQIPSIEAVKGRMMEIKTGQPFRVIVDFAHTPGALKTVVRNLKEHNPNRMAVVIGHAGGRDINNRPELAQSAEEADLIILTTDDPGHEDPVQIAQVMAEALTADGKKEGKDFKVVIDRQEAIKVALEWAQTNDLVLVAGRGHEQTLPVGNTEIPFDDTEVTKKILAQMGYKI